MSILRIRERLGAEQTSAVKVRERYKNESQLEIEYQALREIGKQFLLEDIPELQDYQDLIGYSIVELEQKWNEFFDKGLDNYE